MKKKIQMGIRKHSRCIEAGFLIAICAVWCLTGAIFLGGCGGSGGDVGSGEEQSLPQVQQPTSLTCIHAGQYYSCDTENTCYRDQNLEEETTVIEEVDPSPGITQTSRQYLVKLTTGDITIIAECGSNVIFRLPEENA